jgi:DNA-binding response OmpR family regulator
MISLRILVVEDDFAVAASLAGKLRSMGHDVCAVDMTETDAVVSVCRWRPDLVIIDPWLGDGSGLTELERHDVSRTPQLFVSSDVAGAEDSHPGAVVVDKTCGEIELARAIGRVLQFN